MLFLGYFLSNIKLSGFKLYPFSKQLYSIRGRNTAIFFSIGYNDYFNIMHFVTKYILIRHDFLQIIIGAITQTCEPKYFALIRYI